MPVWLKSILVSAIVLTACWSGVIAFWRSTERTPDTWELGLSLLGLPLVVLTSLWLVPKLNTRRSSGKPETLSATTTTSVAPTSLPTLAILAAALRTPHGSTSAEVSTAISKRKSSADIDPQLHDDDGYPIMSARVREGYDDSLQEAMAAWLTQMAVPDPAFNDEQWRALTLAAAVAGDLSASAASQFGGRKEHPIMRMQLIVPSGWSAEQRNVTGMLLSNAAALAGWPSTHIKVMPDEVTVISAINNIIQCCDAEPAAAAMVIAFASNIGAETVARWASEGSLFTASNPQGAIPGEGAVGLLVTAPALASSLATSFALINPADERERERGNFGAPTVIAELAAGALKRAETDVSKVALIVADTGHHANRAAELMIYANKAMPELDATEDILHTGFACGACGQVAFMTALALACHHALERSAPALAIGNEDPSRRLAAVISPAAKPLG